MSDRRVPSEASVWSQHANALVGAVVVSSVVFVASFIYTSNRDQALLASKLDNVLTELVELKAENRAARSMYFTRIEGKDHEDRLRQLERGRR